MAKTLQGITSLTVIRSTVRFRSQSVVHDRNGMPVRYLEIPSFLPHAQSYCMEQNITRDKDLSGHHLQRLDLKKVVISNTTKTLNIMLW